VNVGALASVKAREHLHLSPQVSDFGVALGGCLPDVCLPIPAQQADEIDERVFDFFSKGLPLKV
jgi:hypothetical protein